MRARRCTICGNKYFPKLPGQRCCLEADCAVAMGRILREKADRIRHRAAVAAAKPLAVLRREAQEAFNAYIRARDAGLPCISCGKYHSGQIHASHYVSVGAHPELRYEEKNCHAACVVCNNYLSGNLIEYRKRLLSRFGVAYVEWLEGPHEPKHYSREALIEIRDSYRLKRREVLKCTAE